MLSIVFSHGYCLMRKKEREKKAKAAMGKATIKGDITNT